MVRQRRKLLLSGLSSLPPLQLLPLARSWISPPAISVIGGDVTGAEYDPSQRAFIVHRTGIAKPTGFTLKLSASTANPLVNPAFVVENWDGPVKVTVSNKSTKSAGSVRVGYSNRLDGDCLVLFVELSSDEETQVRVDPVVK